MPKQQTTDYQLLTNNFQAQVFDIGHPFCAKMGFVRLMKDHVERNERKEQGKTDFGNPGIIVVKEVAPGCKPT